MPMDPSATPRLSTFPRSLCSPSPIADVFERIAFLYFSEAMRLNTAVLMEIIKKRIPATMKTAFF
jgi:hypothetical protein